MHDLHQQIMEEVNGLLEAVDGVTAVHARYYDLCSNFHKVCTAVDVRGHILSLTTVCLFTMLR